MIPDQIMIMWKHFLSDYKNWKCYKNVPLFKPILFTVNWCGKSHVQEVEYMLSFAECIVNPSWISKSWWRHVYIRKAIWRQIWRASCSNAVLAEKCAFFKKITSYSFYVVRNIFWMCRIGVAKKFFHMIRQFSSAYANFSAPNKSISDWRIKSAVCTMCKCGSRRSSLRLKNPLSILQKMFVRKKLSFI